MKKTYNNCIEKIKNDIKLLLAIENLGIATKRAYDIIFAYEQVLKMIEDVEGDE